MSLVTGGVFGNLSLPCSLHPLLDDEGRPPASFFMVVMAQIVKGRASVSQVALAHGHGSMWVYHNHVFHSEGPRFWNRRCESRSIHFNGHPCRIASLCHTLVRDRTASASLNTGCYISIIIDRAFLHCGCTSRAMLHLTRMNGPAGVPGLSL